MFAVDFELGPKEGHEERISTLTKDPILHGVNFRIRAEDPVTALEFGIEKLRTIEPKIGDLIRTLEACVEPI